MSPITAAMRHLPALLFAGALLLAPAFAATPPTPAAAPATPAGEVILLTGRGTAMNPQTGAVRPLAKGDKVYAGDVLNTQANSYLNVRFSDGAFMLLRPNTRFAIEAYAYAEPAAATAAPAPVAKPAAPAPAATVSTPAASETGGVQRAFLRLLKGGFRTVSGLIGKANPEEYRVTTPVATIGIRGTDYYSYICDLACASDAVVLESLDLQHIDHGLALGATLNGVISGRIAVTNNAGHTELLGAGEYLITLSDGRQIRLPREPGFLRVQPFPDPLTLCAS
ncbi:FecR family protein [Solimonas soli]|uniref:FecR family protein n=1 Tax=Solimonas soli TaxID=413479 RepID=UPI00048298E4|nr:FecR domain-containing protein [Solimonas soli]